MAGHAQNILTLKECYDMAMTAVPIAGEKTVYSQISAVKEKNLLKSWLPTIDAGGSFIYNSSVVDMTEALGNIPIPGIEDLIEPLPTTIQTDSRYQPGDIRWRCCKRCKSSLKKPTLI